MKSLLPTEFPRRLREIPDPPKVLYLAGVLPPEESKWLCVVGSRKYSSYGKEVCERLLAGLAGTDTVVVSGLALGIDAIAHRAALDAHLPCAAVPGSGLSPEALYPATNKRLADDIIASGGALLSEFPPDFRATAWSFPQRNRIMAGLSDAVLIIEAEARSGSLITSRLATEYNRDVCTVPGSIFSASSAGPHMLLRLGATPITSAEELREALGFGALDLKIKPRDYSDCTADERAVVEALAEPRSREALIEALGWTASRVNALLSMMELKGLVSETLGEIHLS